MVRMMNDSGLKLLYLAIWSFWCCVTVVVAVTRRVEMPGQRWTFFKIPTKFFLKLCNLFETVGTEFELAQCCTTFSCKSPSPFRQFIHAPIRIMITYVNSNRSFAISMYSLDMSMPTQSLLFEFAILQVVSLPHMWSSTISPSFDQDRIWSVANCSFLFYLHASKLKKGLNRHMLNGGLQQSIRQLRFPESAIEAECELVNIFLYHL